MSLPHSLLQAWSNLNTFKAQVFHTVCSLRVYHTSLVKTSLKFLICRNTIKSHIFHQPYFPKHLETELDYINFCSWRRLVCLSESTLGALGNAKILKVLQNKESWWLFIHSFIQGIFNGSLPHRPGTGVLRSIMKKNNSDKKEGNRRRGWAWVLL